MNSSGYLKLDLDTWYTVALKYPKPVEVKGWHGPELRWLLLDGKALYTPPDLEAKLSRIKPGIRFQIGKFRNGRTVVWKIQPDQSQEQPAATLLDASDDLESPTNEIPSTALENALKTAVSAAAAAEKHAAQIGYTVRFTPQDIRAMGISVLIDQGRRVA